MNQIFEAASCKICARLLKDGQTQNQLALCKGWKGKRLWWANTQGCICSLLVVCCVKMGMTIMSS